MVPQRAGLSRRGRVQGHSAYGRLSSQDSPSAHYQQSYSYTPKARQCYLRGANVSSTCCRCKWPFLSCRRYCKTPPWLRPAAMQQRTQMPVQQGDPTVPSAFSPGQEYDAIRRETCPAAPPRDLRSRSPHGLIHGAGRWRHRAVTGLWERHPLRSSRSRCDSSVSHLSPAARSEGAARVWCDRRRGHAA